MKDRKVTSWWFPDEYDFVKAQKINDEDWANRYDDIPDTTNMLSKPIDKNGKRWIILEGYPEWTEKSEDMEWSDKYRNIWLHLRSYLIPTNEINKCFQWIQKQNFFGRWMPEGIEFSQGYIGEYPWATIFNLFKDISYTLGRYEDRELPCTMYPTCNTLTSHYEYDSFQEGTINFLLPAKRFFNFDELKWNGLNAYHTKDGIIRLQDPSVMQQGPSALLADSEYLKELLAKNNLSIVWTIIGEKLIINDRPAPRLVYSRGHIFTKDGMLSSKPVITHD